MPAVNRSGAMYANVPTIMPVLVSRVAAASWAIPKSIRYTKSRAVTNALDGSSTSRCTNPAVRRVERGGQLLDHLHSALRLIGPSRCNKVSRASMPSTTGITRYNWLSISPVS